MVLDLFEQECALCSSFRRPGSAQLFHQKICQHQMGLAAEDLCARIPPHWTIAAWSGCTCLLWYPLWRCQAADSASRLTCFPHLLLDSSLFGGNSWAQKQHCKTIYTETKMVLASSWKSCVWVFLAWLWDK